MLSAELSSTLVKTFVARCIAAIGMLVLGIVVARLYGPEGVGVFALAQSCALGAAILSRYGMDTALMRYVGQDGESDQLNQFLYWAAIRALPLSLCVATAIWLFRTLIEQAFGADGLANTLSGISIAIPAYTFGFLVSGFLKGVHKPTLACLLETGSISLLAAILTVALDHIAVENGVSNAGFAFALSSWLILFVGCCALLKWRSINKLRPPTQSVSRQGFYVSARSYFFISLAQFFQQVIMVFIAGFYLIDYDLGLFKSAERAAVIVSFILVVLNAVFPPRFAKLHFQQDFKSLERLARQGAALGMICALPSLIVCLFLSEYVLQLFGKEFREGGVALAIIGTAQYINVAVGSVGLLLNMTGHERLFRNITLATNICGTLLLWAFVQFFGYLGAAVALAVTLACQNLIALYFVWRLHGIWTLPLPNAFYIFGVQAKSQDGNGV